MHIMKWKLDQNFRDLWILLPKLSNLLMSKTKFSNLDYCHQPNAHPVTNEEPLPGSACKYWYSRLQVCIKLLHCAKHLIQIQLDGRPNSQAFFRLLAQRRPDIASWKHSAKPNAQAFSCCLPYATPAAHCSYVLANFVVVIVGCYDCVLN